MSKLDRIFEVAKGNKQRIVIPECTNAIMMRAAYKFAKDGLGEVIFIGDPKEVKAVADANAIDLSAFTLIDIADESYKEDLLERYMNSGKAILGRGSVKGRMKNPIYFGMVMEVVGDADAIIAGLNEPTGAIIMAASSIIGLKEGVASASMFFACEFKKFEAHENAFIAMSDGGVTVDPTPEQLAGIAIACSDTYQALSGEESRCALLSFSTCGSGNAPSVDKVVAAKTIANELRPDLKIDGEFQVDAALLPRVAEKKVKRDSEVAGKANVLIYPNIEAANIGSKFVQMVSDSIIYGPIVQGFKLPVCDCSRSDTEDILYNNMACTCVLAIYEKNN